MVFHVIDCGRVWPAWAYVSDCVSKALNRWRYLRHFEPSDFISFSHNYYLSTKCDMVNIQPIIVLIFHFGVNLIGQKKRLSPTTASHHKYFTYFHLIKIFDGKANDATQSKYREKMAWVFSCTMPFIHVLIRMIVLSVNRQIMHSQMQIATKWNGQSEWLSKRMCKCILCEILQISWKKTFIEDSLLLAIQ